jgi:RND family efflux transporter MFP subunit
MNKLLLAALCLALVACGKPTGSAEAEAGQKTTSVTVALPEKRDIDYVLTALGSVESIENPTVSAETNGQLVTVDAFEGQMVEAGQLLASIDNTLHQIEAAKAEADLQRHSVLMENQQQEVARLKRLEQSRSVSRDQFEDEQAQLAVATAQAEYARKQLEYAQYMLSRTRVIAPQKGLIARRHISLGDYVTVSTPLFDLVSVERLKARLAFPEHDASKIRLGKKVYLTSPVAPDVTAIGEVTAVNPKIDVHSRSMELTVEFDNPGGWLPGGSVDATLVIESRSNAVTVSPTSIVTRDGREVVFVIDANNRAVSRPVTIGWREVDWVEIVAGIAPRDRLVVEGSALISDGSLLAERQ